MTDLITSSECAKELGLSRRTLMRWEEKGWLSAVTRDQQGNRLYRLHHVRWAARRHEEWENLRAFHRKHLQKLPAVQQRLGKLIHTQPLERTYDREPVDLKELQEAIRLMEEWKTMSREIDKLYSDFFESVQDLKLMARGIEAGRVTSKLC
jgi:DNA-binding transcriptional MerR regulator